VIDKQSIKSAIPIFFYIIIFNFCQLYIIFLFFNYRFLSSNFWVVTLTDPGYTATHVVVRWIQFVTLRAYVYNING